jgi:predicted chitinase
MTRAQIATHLREAAFLAQLAHESGELRWLEELASGAAYEGRRDLGNTQPGDGKRFKGRGPIQITGRANYRAAGKALDLPLVQRPELAAYPQHGFDIATWFWTTRRLNALADQSAFRLITRRINGGMNGYADRLAYYTRALRVLSRGDQMPVPIKILVNGKDLTKDADPEKDESGAIFAAVRPIAEALGATVTWDESAKAVVITGKGG